MIWHFCILAFFFQSLPLAEFWHSFASTHRTGLSRCQPHLLTPFPASPTFPCRSFSWLLHSKPSYPGTVPWKLIFSLWKKSTKFMLMYLFSRVCVQYHFPSEYKLQVARAVLSVFTPVLLVSWMVLGGMLYPQSFMEPLGSPSGVLFFQGFTEFTYCQTWSPFWILLI